MIDPLAFIPAIAAILATPGPTNTLLAISGARAGFRRSLPLVPAELAGYAIAIAAWGAFLEPASNALPGLKPALKLACAIYLVAIAWSLWRTTGDGQRAGRLGVRHVFSATLLNPKALLFAVAIFPETAFRDVDGFLQTMGLFAATIVPIAMGWIGFGSSLSGPNARIRPHLVQRGAALVLLSFSVSLGATALG
ncbi:MAG TPA: LysE family transporter [Microvirga sp.]|nr:LysE family transporter [Microvirga sp.]